MDDKRTRKVDVRKKLSVVRGAAEGEVQTGSVAPGVEHEEAEETHLVVALLGSAVVPTPFWKLSKSENTDINNTQNNNSKNIAKNIRDIKNNSDEIESNAKRNNAHGFFALPTTKIRCATEPQPVGYCCSEQDIAFAQSLALEPHLLAFAISTLDDQGDAHPAGPPPLESVVPILQMLETTNALDIINNTINSVYNYWSDCRYTLNAGARIHCLLKAEETSTNPDSDPYVCFRVREIKNTRRVRRNDVFALEKTRKLRLDLVKSHQVALLVLQRENLHAELCELEFSVMMEYF